MRKAVAVTNSSGETKFHDVGSMSIKVYIQEEHGLINYQGSFQGIEIIR